jgi:predicted transcriptional regulator
MTVHMTIAIDESLEAQLRVLADLKKVSPEDLVSNLVAESLDYDRWYAAEVQKGLDELDTGRVFTDEEVWERSAKRREELLARSRK